MWVVCCGMSRSGSTLQYQLAKSIVEYAGKGIGMGWLDRVSLEEKMYREANPNKMLVVKCHEFFDLAGQFINRGSARGVYIYRDLRDVIVSKMNKDKKDFVDISCIETISSLIETDIKWRGLGNLYASKYEEVTGCLAHEIRNISSFLNISVDDDFVTKTGSEHSLGKQRIRISTFNYESSGASAMGNIYDPDTLLHKNHINSGKTKQWEVQLSPMETALIEKVSTEWLSSRGYLLSQPVYKRKIAKMVYLLRKIRKSMQR